MSGIMVCYPIACVEWTLYAHVVAMSIVQCKLMQMNVVPTHTLIIAKHPIAYPIGQSIGHYIAHWYIAIESTLYDGRTGRLSLGDREARPNRADPH
jgi:uncharacterized membrane protein